MGAAMPCGFACDGWALYHEIFTGPTAAMVDPLAKP